MENRLDGVEQRVAFVEGKLVFLDLPQYLDTASRRMSKVHEDEDLGQRAEYSSHQNDDRNFDV